MDKKRGKSAFFNDDEFEIKEPVLDDPVKPEQPRKQTRKQPPVVETSTNPLTEDDEDDEIDEAVSKTAKLLGMIEAKPEGKTCGFYLSTAAIKKLDKAAKQLKCSKSKALDLLIRKYL